MNDKEIFRQSYNARYKQREESLLPSPDSISYALGWDDSLTAYRERLLAEIERLSRENYPAISDSDEGYEVALRDIHEFIEKEQTK